MYAIETEKIGEGKLFETRGEITKMLGEAGKKIKSIEFCKFCRCLGKLHHESGINMSCCELTLDTTGLNLKVFTQLLKHAPRKERWSGPKTHRHHKPFAGIDDSIVVENLVEYDAVGLVVLEEAAQYAKRQHEHAKQALA